MTRRRYHGFVVVVRIGFEWVRTVSRNSANQPSSMGWPIKLSTGSIRWGWGSTAVTATRNSTTLPASTRNARATPARGEIDRSADPRFRVRRRQSRGCGRQVNCDDEFTGGKRQVVHAVIVVEICDRDTPCACGAEDFHLGLVNDQSWRHIAAERGKTERTVWRDVAHVTPVLEAKIVAAAPPFALVVVNASRIEAQIAAKGAIASMGSDRQPIRRPRQLPHNRGVSPRFGQSLQVSHRHRSSRPIHAPGYH